MTKNDMRCIARERRPFEYQYGFMLTPFERRGQHTILTTRRYHTWRVIGSDSGGGLSLGLVDLARRLNGHKNSNGETSMPLLWAVAPRNHNTEGPFCASLADRFGTVPPMSSEVRRTWLMRQGKRCHVDTIVVDNAQWIAEAHVMYIMEFADTVEIATGGRRIAVVFLCSTVDGLVSLKEKFEKPGSHWQQVRERLSPEWPYEFVAGHTATELDEVCGGFEDMYRPQLPDLNLVDHSGLLFEMLSVPLFDTDVAKRAAMINNGANGGKRVAMRHVTNVINSAVESAYYLGRNDVDAEILVAAAEVQAKGRTVIHLLENEPVRIDPFVLNVDGEPEDMDPIVFDGDGGRMIGESHREVAG